MQVYINGECRVGSLKESTLTDLASYNRARSARPFIAGGPVSEDKEIKQLDPILVPHEVVSCGGVCNLPRVGLFALINVNLRVICFQKEFLISCKKNIFGSIREAGHKRGGTRLGVLAVMGVVLEICLESIGKVCAKSGQRLKPMDIGLGKRGPCRT